MPKLLQKFNSLNHKALKISTLSVWQSFAHYYLPAPEFRSKIYCTYCIFPTKNCITPAGSYPKLDRSKKIIAQDRLKD